MVLDAGGIMWGNAKHFHNCLIAHKPISLFTELFVYEYNSVHNTSSFKSKKIFSILYSIHM